ncbi:MAG: glycosyltransferase family 4 protein [Kofleriaceae bacterium]
MVQRPRIVCALQLPPPLHGVTAMNAQVVASEALRQELELDIVPLRFSDTVAELGTVKARKLVRAGVVAAQLVRRFARGPAAFYITLAPQRPAIARDAAYLALARAARIPRVVHLHARPEPAVLPILRRALHGASVILLAPALRPDLDDVVDDAHVHYIPNGIPDTPAPVRAARSVPRILFLSHLLLDKGPLVLIEALSELARRGLVFEATFAGAPTRALPAEALRVALAPLAGRARYIGSIDSAAMPALFSDHDVLAYPSRADAFPRVLVEALRAGIPIVASDVGAVAELVGDAGLIVPPGDPRRLADELARVLVAPALRAELGAAARARYCANYTVARWESALGAVIKAALSTR